MLGIVNPSTLVRVDAVKNKFSKAKGREIHDCRSIVDLPMVRVSVQHSAKFVTDVVQESLWEKMQIQW